MKNALLGLAFFVGAIGTVNAQQSPQEPCGDPATTWNYPEDKKTASEKNARYNDEMKLGNYRAAATALHWLLKNAPTFNPAIYINGVTIYDELANAEKDPAKQKVYQDSVLTLYDLRIKHYCNEAENMERKAYYAYKYFAADKDRLPVLYNTLKRTAELNQEKMSFANAVGYMVAMQRYKAANPNALTDEQVLDQYDIVMKALDNALQAQPEQAETIDKYKGIVDNLLIKMVNVDCDFVEKNFGPKMQQNPSDVQTAKKVFKLLRVGNCTDRPLYLNAITTIYQSEPTFELAKYLALKYIGEKNYSEANKYINEAISMATTTKDKGELFLLQAQLAGQRGSKSEARSLAYKAAEADPSSASKAYSLIGRLYMDSQECYGNQDIVADRAIYIAAYEMFQRAGDSGGMSRAKAQFPSKGELFDKNIAVGSEMKVGCWINETVTLRTRD
ncbi:hypothetical protein [Cesiribacter sp. SM1]|uniref:hypothetical protein n=1 Tax=Cesiribacter sp. SM1 TaxID=2861196 RepID=UPI001CD7517A|nr:hypothetical protein [Cesiribacter sp. SM1]